MEKGTRTPLASANVFVEGNDDLVTVSDESGHFTLSIPKPGHYSISAVSLGHDKARPFLVKVNNKQPTPNITLYLVNNAVLAEIVVKGERSLDRVAKTRITGKELERVAGGAGDPLRAMQTLPGMVVNNDGSAAPAIRGSRPGDNAYYVDFLPVGYLFHMGGVVSVFPADLVDDFNLFASAFGPEFADVTGAVIDVSLREPRTDRLGGKVNVSFINADFLVEGPVAENQSLLFSARRSYLDLVLDEIDDDEEGTTIEVPTYFDYLGKYLWDLNDNNRLSFYLTGAGDKLGFNIESDADIALKDPILAGQSQVDKSFHSQAMVWDARVSGLSRNKLALGYRENTDNATFGGAGEQQVTSRGLYLRELFQTRIGKDHTLFLGGMAQTIDVDLEVDAVNPLCTEFDPDCDLTSATRRYLRDTLHIQAWSLSARDRWRAAPRLHLIGGLRYSFENYLDEDRVEPRLGVEWQFTPQTLFTLGWGKHNQFPQGVHVVEEFGNPGIRHIRATHSSLGLSHSIGDDWLVKGELYYKTFKDFVVSHPTLNYDNGAHGKSYGLELLIKREDTGPVSGWLSVTAADADRTINASDETIPFEYDQPLNSTLVLNYRHSKRWSFGLSWRYHSGAPYTPVIGRYSVTDPDGNTRLRPLYGETNSRRLPAYHRLDLRVDRDFVYNRFLLNTYLEIINAYNQENVSGYSYNPDYSRRKNVKQLPLIPSIGVKVTF